MLKSEGWCLFQLQRQTHPRACVFMTLTNTSHVHPTFSCVDCEVSVSVLSLTAMAEIIPRYIAINNTHVSLTSLCRGSSVEVSKMVPLTIVVVKTPIPASLLRRHAIPVDVVVSINALLLACLELVSFTLKRWVSSVNFI